MTTAIDVVRAWLVTWRTLRAWRAPLDVALAVEPYRGGRELGLARDSYCTGRSATVWVTGHLAEDLSTALHELAHLAAPRSTHHGALWRETYAAGAQEALGLPPYSLEPDVTAHDLDVQVREACEAWLTRTGQRVMLRAAGLRC